MKHEFTEQRFDYSQGRKDAPELVICVGVSGCGKSTWAKQEVNRARGKIVRLNRDDMRKMLYADVPYEQRDETMLRDSMMKDLARTSLQRGYTVIVDDTNCIRRTRQGWEELAQQTHVRFRIVTFTTDIKECIERDRKRGEACSACGRPNGAMVGESVIKRQQRDLASRKAEKPKKEYKLTRPYFERTEYLRNGGWVIRLPLAQWVLVDVDGTLADAVHRHQHDESRVLTDEPRPVAVEWVRALYPHYNICIVSGRHDHCGDDTCDWLEMHGIPFDHILMRYSGDNRSDVIVKQEILDEFAAVFGKAGVAFVIDDRPRVVEMWRSNGIRVFPVRGTWGHTEACTFDRDIKGHKECPECGALEYY